MLGYFRRVCAVRDEKIRLIKQLNRTSRIIAEERALLRREVIDSISTIVNRPVIVETHREYIDFTTQDRIGRSRIIASLYKERRAIEKKLEKYNWKSILLGRIK